MKIAVAGATGAVGSHVVTELERAGHAVVPLARSTGADLTTGTGLAERLQGVDALIDCVSITSMKAKESRDFFTATSTNMIEAERTVGVTHHVALSIVGIDKVPLGYYQGKVAQERVVRESSQPYTILRATQFHEFAEQMLERGKVGPLLMAPTMISAPIIAVPLGFGAAARAVRNGDLVSKRAWRVGRQSFQDWRRERR